MVKKLSKIGRRTLSVVLCAVMLLTTFFIFDPSVLKITAKAAVWNGSTSATSGTDYTVSGSVMHIKTPNGLAYFINNLGSYSSKTVYLDNDVDLNNNDNFPINTTAFTGTFDGQGKTIYNYKNEVGLNDDNVGFFRYATGATFRNIKFSNARVGNFDTSYDGGDNDGTGYGILVGKINSATKTVIAENITIEKSTVCGRADVGGLFGTVNGPVSITECHVSSKIDCVRKSGHGKLSNCLGGMIGFTNASATVKNCTYSNYGTDGIYGRQRSGGMIGEAQSTTVIENCSNMGTISNTGDSPNCVGGLVGAVSGTLTVSGKYPTQAYTNSGKLSCNGDSVAGVVGYCKVGTIDNCVNNGAISSNSGLVGGIVGNGDPGSSTGLTIKNCKNITSSFSANGENIGGIIGKNSSDNPLKLENCHNTTSISVAQKWVGGLVGYDKGALTMNNCSNTGNVTGRQHTAGLVAGIQDDGCTITNCLNTGTVATGTASTGYNNNGSGVLATVESTVDGSTWTFSNTVNTGTIYAAAALGGFIGYLDDNKGVSVNFTNCVNKGNIVSTGAEAAGFVGNMYNHGTHKYTNCYNYGDVSSSSTGTSFIAGIVGREYGFGYFTNCINYGKITKTSTSGDNVTGGIAAWIQDDTSSFSKCINYGDLKGRNNVGGILGEVSTDAYSASTFTLTECGNYGAVKTTNSNTGYLGGIVGRFDGKKSNSPKLYIIRCFNGDGWTGSTTRGQIGESGMKGDYAGGILGTTWREVFIVDSYCNTYAVYGNSQAGGIVGYAGATINLRNTYFKKYYGATQIVGNVGDSSYTGNTNYNSSTITTGADYVTSTRLNKTYSVSGISSVGNAYVYKQGVNSNYPVLSWQVNTLTKNIGRNLLADLIADTANSGFTGSGSTYTMVYDGPKSYYQFYTKTVNGVTVMFNTLDDTFTFNGTPTATGSFDILSMSNPNINKTTYRSSYYIGGYALNGSVRLQNVDISRDTAKHESTSITTATLTMNVTQTVSKFDNYKVHASLDYAGSLTASSGALVDLDSVYPTLGTLSKTGYSFLGWYNQRIGGTKITENSMTVNVRSSIPNFSDTLDRDYDVYARWQPNTITVKFNGNGATDGSMSDQAFSYDVPQALTKNGFTRSYTVNYDGNFAGKTPTLGATSQIAEYVFKNWNNQSNGSGSYNYSNQQTVTNPNGSTGGTVNLYAQWTPTSVTLPTASLTGYTFDGWYDAKPAETESAVRATAIRRQPESHSTPIGQ